MRKKFILRELAKALFCEMHGDPEWIIEGVDNLKSAQKNELSFFANDAFLKDFLESKAGVICVSNKLELKHHKNYLISKNPTETFQKAVELLCHDASRSGFIGIHPTSVVHQTVKIGKNVSIGPHSVIDRNVIIGDNTTIAPHVSIGPEVSIGSDCYLHPNSVIREGCTLHNRVILQPGAVIGGCGYGYTQNEKNESQKIRHFGSVILEDDVEIGANATIDRGRFKPTRIGKGVKIDNLVMIAHNTEIGENSLIIAQAGIAGSTKIGKNCIIAAQAGLVGHLHIEDQVIIAAQSGVGKSIYKPGFYGAALTAVPINEYRRRSAHINRLDKYVEQIKLLRKRVDTLEAQKIQESSCEVFDS